MPDIGLTVVANVELIVETNLGVVVEKLVEGGVEVGGFGVGVGDGEE